MPIAIVSSAITRFDLKTLEGAFVELKRMSYGQILDRRAMMTLSLETNNKSKDVRGELAMANRKVQEFEFQNCVVTHNLQNADETPMNLALVSQITILDPRVAQEIEKLISDMNNYENEATEGN